MEPRETAVDATHDARPVCPHCLTPFTRRRWNQVYCTPKCKFAAWTKLHPRKPNGCVIVPVGSRVVLPLAQEGAVVQGDVLLGRPAIGAPEGANAVVAGDSGVAAPLWGLAEVDARLSEVERVVAELPKFGRSSGQDPTRWKHGANCYRNHGCRCSVCLAGVKARSLARRKTVVTPTHG